VQSAYDKVCDSQEGVLHTVLDEMTEQNIKEMILAYFLLRLSGARDPGGGGRTPVLCDVLSVVLVLVPVLCRIGHVVPSWQPLIGGGAWTARRQWP
jgi:hypothetical protein